MHSHSVERWTHAHVFLGAKHARNERRTWFVVALTVVMMVGEIVAGILSGSMALLADGWHMATHAVALGIAALAYFFARRQARNAHFTFGTGKFGDLAAFASAIILAIVAIQIAFESVERLVNPVTIAYRGAIAVAVLGLAVNLASAFLLREEHDDQHHGHGHAPDPGHHHHRDNTLRAAFVHVLADAATSVLAIAALLTAAYLQWAWADPVVGIVGAAVIASWAVGLLRSSGSVLLDVNNAGKMEGLIRQRLETRGDRVTDLHLWQIGPGHSAAVVSLISDDPLPPSDYKVRLSGLHGLSHVTVEVETCRHEKAGTC